MTTGTVRVAFAPMDGGLTVSQRSTLDALLDRYAEFIPAPTRSATPSGGADEVFARLRAELLQVADLVTQADREGLTWLKESWPAFTARAFAANEAELASLKASWRDRESDPVFWRADLLSPLGCERHEPSHTLILSHLLDPARPHGLDHRFLDRLLRKVAKASTSALNTEDARQIANALPLRDHQPVRIEAERVARLVGDSRRSRPRTDLWIESPEHRPRLIVVIENKIDACEGTEQLEDYESIIDARLRGLANESRPVVVTVYLTPNGDPSKTHAGRSWIPLSYWAIAGALRRSMDPISDSSEAAMPGLYLSTILRHVLGIDAHRAESRSSAGKLIKYLKEFLHDD